MKTSAEISACGLYRYVLGRRWSSEDGNCLWIMLNPSTADHRDDDPTIRRITRFSKEWGFGSLTACNLFGWRASDPHFLQGVTPETLVGPINDVRIKECAEKADKIMCGWGTKGTLHGRGKVVKARLIEAGHSLHCLSMTKNGHPSHPLYIKADKQPIIFEATP